MFKNIEIASGPPLLENQLWITTATRSLVLKPIGVEDCKMAVLIIFSEEYDRNAFRLLGGNQYSSNALIITNPRLEFYSFHLWDVGFSCSVTLVANWSINLFSNCSSIFSLKLLLKCFHNRVLDNGSLRILHNLVANHNY